MRELVFNLLALAMFGIVLTGEQTGLLETREAHEERVKKEKEERAEAKRLQEVKDELERSRLDNERRIREERQDKIKAAVEQKEDKDRLKSEIAAALDEAAKLPRVERKKQASKLKKEMIKLVTEWGESDEDVAWMQRMISTKYRRLRQ